MNPGRLLIAGVGNVFFGDDGFGVEVARRIAERALPDGVRAVDFGIRGLDLVFALLDPWEAVVIVDAMPRGGPIGTVYVLEPDLDAPVEVTTAVDPHAMNPLNVLRTARDLGSKVQRVLLVGCEPSPLEQDDDMCMELSEPVADAVEEAIDVIESLMEKLLELPAAKEVPSCTSSPSQ
jgi:hydrogenase maturation protease